MVSEDSSSLCSRLPKRIGTLNACLSDRLPNLIGSLNRHLLQRESASERRQRAPHRDDNTWRTQVVSANSIRRMTSWPLVVITMQVMSSVLDQLVRLDIDLAIDLNRVLNVVVVCR